MREIGGNGYQTAPSQRTYHVTQTSQQRWQNVGNFERTTFPISIS